MTAKEIAASIVHKNLETELSKCSAELKFALEKSIEQRIREYGMGLVSQFMSKASFDVDRGIVLIEEINY